MTKPDSASVSQIAGSRPVAKLIAVEKLTVFPEVQRTPPTKKLVMDIADKLDLSALGAFHVSQRDDGSLSTMDGQRRRQALLVLGMGSYKVNCLVYTGLTVKQEAAMFRLLNKSRLVGKFDDFEKGIVAGDPRDVGIAASLRRIGWGVSRATTSGTASCVKALRDVWDMDPTGALLTKTVDALDKIYGRDKHTMASSLVSGMAKAILEIGGSASTTELVEKVRSKFANSPALVGAAKGRAHMDGGSLSENVAALIVSCYLGRKKPTR